MRNGGGQTTEKKQIIVNADDFGRHREINRAVAECVERGCLRSASIMPGGEAFDDAVEVARAHPELGVGVHLTLANGRPVLPRIYILSLVKENGEFYDDYHVFVKRFLAGKVHMEEVRRELAAQLRRAESTGLPITHVDSHQHLHVLPGIIDAVLAAAKARSIPAVRIPRAPLFAGSAAPGAVIGRMGLSVLAARAAGKARARGFGTPDHFAGIVAGEAVDEERLLAIIDRMKPGTTEVMMHPGADTAVLQAACQWDHDFEAERDALLSPRVLDRLRERNIEITNFRALGKTKEAP